MGLEIASLSKRYRKCVYNVRNNLAHAEYLLTFMQYAYTLYALALIHSLFHVVCIDPPQDRRFDVVWMLGSALVFVDSYVSIANGESNHYSN